MLSKAIKENLAGKIVIVVIASLILLLLLFHDNPLANADKELIKKIIAILIDVCATFILVIKYDSIKQLVGELFQNRRLIWKLSKNDFKTKYAGSYLGVIWAFIQPIVTILVYWFVFQVIFQSRGQILGGDIKIPFVLYLTAGLVPWLYFSEALMSGTNSFRVYSYLVKKVVFKVSILPIIRVLSATFVHVAFVGFILILNICLGNFPTLYWIQIIYFSFCMFVFSLAFTYATSSMVVFFKDLTQIINIVLQVGVWASPIMWNITQFPEKYRIIFKLNPIYYIINGFRISLYEGTWFWQDFYSTMYFWIVTIGIAAFGILIFKKLKPHFADVL
jgi:teichoic acid transport system permease protein